MIMKTLIKFSFINLINFFLIYFDEIFINNSENGKYILVFLIYSIIVLKVSLLVDLFFIITIKKYESYFFMVIIVLIINLLIEWNLKIFIVHLISILLYYILLLCIQYFNSNKKNML